MIKLQVESLSNNNDYYCSSSVQFIQVNAVLRKYVSEGFKMQSYKVYKVREYTSSQTIAAVFIIIHK